MTSLRRNIQRALLLTAIISLHQSVASAQAGLSPLSGPGVALQADYLPASNYIRPEDSLKTESTTAIRRYNLVAMFNLYKRADTATGKFRAWNLGVGGSYMKFSNNKYEKNIMPQELLGAGIALQHVRSINKKWSMMGVLTAGIYSDMLAIDANDLFLNGGVVFIKQQSPRFSYGFGAMLTNAFGSPMVLPAFLVKWNTTGKFNVELSFPEGAKVSYAFNQFFVPGIALRLNGASYDVENRPDNERLMAYKEVTLGLENTFKLGKHFSFNISGGTALLRSVDYREKSLSQMFKTKPEHRLGTSWYASTGVSLNLGP